MLRWLSWCMLLIAAGALQAAGAQAARGASAPPSAVSAAAPAASPPATLAPAPPSPASGAQPGETAPAVASIVLALSSLLLASAGVYLIVNGLRNRRPEGFSFRRHIGGFGGGSTGWQLSEQLAWVLCGLVLVLIAAAMAMQQTVVPGSAKGDSKPSAPAGAAAASAAK